MASQMDALTSFVYLTDNLPVWAGQVRDLSGHTSKRHSEFAAEYTRLLKYARPKKQKSPSLISHRSSEHAEVERPRPSENDTASNHRLELDPLEAGNRYIFASARRHKKTTGASMRSGVSGPQKFRQRHAVVIYYDSHVQNSCEAMVKNLSIARNNLRKGKKNYMLSQGPMLPTFTAPSSNRFGDHIGDFKRSLYVAHVNIDPKSPDSVTSTSPASKGFSEACFDMADKELEQAQSLCETAAHQFLRDGDVSVELKNILERLERITAMAKTTVEKLREEERLANIPEESVEQTEDIVLNAEKEKRGEDIISNISFISTVGKSGPGDLNRNKPVSAIEVDDDNGEEIQSSYDMSKYRAMIRPRTAQVGG